MNGDFVKVHDVFLFSPNLGGVVKLPSIECMSISLKFRIVFCKINIHKVRVLFCKLLSMDYGLISPKFEGFFTKSRFPTVPVRFDG